MSTPALPTAFYTSSAAAVVLPGSQTKPQEDAPELLGTRSGLPGGDRVELSEEGMELLGAATGLPGEGTGKLEEGEPPFCENCGTYHFPSSDGGSGSAAATGSTGGTAGTAEAGDGYAAAATVQAPAAPAVEAPGAAGSEVGHVHSPGDGHTAAAALEEDGDESASVDPNATGLDPKEEAEVEQLKERDREVRAHEQAHVAAGGQYVRGGIQFEYATGPDGKRYAVGGEVSIDTSPIPGDPQATILKAQVVRRAALAPAQPSSADRSVAATASRMEAEARRDLLEEKTEGATSDGGGEEEEAVIGQAEASAAAAEGVKEAAELPEPGLGGPEPLSEQASPLEELSGIDVSTEAKGDDGSRGLSALTDREDDTEGLPEPPKTSGSISPPQMSLDHASVLATGGLLDVRG